MVEKESPHPIPIRNECGCGGVPFSHNKAPLLSWFDSLERSPRGSAEEPGLLVEAGVPPLGEVNALEHARLAGHAGVDVVVGQHHGVHL